jgi:hypothetical protein
MNPLLSHSAAVLLAFVRGSIVNLALIPVSPRVIPPRPGVGVANVAHLKASLHVYQPRHFLFPFLAHALGTFAGALIAFVVAGSRRAVFACALGLRFLAAGITAGFLLPAPAWFMALDLLAAYLPMAWLATRLGRRLTAPTPASLSP